MAEEPEEAGAEEGTKKKGGGKKIIIIAAIALVLVAGGGGFAYMKFFAGGGHEGETAEKKKEVADPKELLFPLNAFVVNLGKPGKFLKVNMQLELADPEVKPLIEGKVPQIRDSIIMLLGNKTAASVTTAEGKLRTKDEINFRLNQILGDNLVTNVYFTEFVMQ